MDTQPQTTITDDTVTVTTTQQFDKEEYRAQLQAGIDQNLDQIANIQEVNKGIQARIDELDN